MNNETSKRDEAETLTGFVEVFMSNCSVMDWRMMFDKIFCFVGFAWDPVKEEVSLTCSILDPIEYYVH